MQSFDIVIVGGGMAGLTAALCFAQHNLSIGLIEAVEPKSCHTPGFDQRAIALSASSIRIFKSLGAWPLIRGLAQPIEHIHVSDQGQCQFTRLDAKAHNLDQFGAVIPLDAVGPILWRQVAKKSNISLFCPATPVSINQHESKCTLSFEISGQSGILQTSLLIAADGTFSKIAQLCGIDVARKPYAQTAVIANIKTQKPHRNCAFERFTPQGPLALLPLQNNQMSLVWCHDSTHAESIMAKNDEDFMADLQQEFGYRLGQILKVSERYSYPLALHQTKAFSRGRVLMLGNAAHTLHPIAGQGFNLGLRDVAVANDLILQAKSNEFSLGDPQFMQQYQMLRASDWQLTVGATDGLVKLFSNDWLPVSLLRSKALGLINLLPFAKQQLVNAATGYSGHSSRLARGLANPVINIDNGLTD
ncbi:2-octaprenyl-6-methoxyphenyl hydroxylase [Aliikangiella maris]|uniref:2-octaprenyl-6-methoxyphenyl hydroxylase n=2 Tax=Aliikangiella maris TaxID=3162458 RepID=A0ABV2BWH6_9GAMM